MKVKEIDTGIVGYGRGIVYVDGKYYMVSNTPAKVCVSEDLENWTEYSLDDSYLRPTEIAYGNNTFIIVGNSGTRDATYIYVSHNGTDWIPKTVDVGYSVSYGFNKVEFINNRFICQTGYQFVNSKGQTTKIRDIFFETKDGNSITRHDKDIITSEKIFTRSICYGNGTYFTVGDLGNIFYSTNLNTWTKIKSPVKSHLMDIVYARGQFIIVGFDGVIMTSNDGKSWMVQDSGTNFSLRKIRYANGMYIACGYNGAILQSIDGVSWNNISNTNEGLRWGMAYNNIDNKMVITAVQNTVNKTIPIYLLTLSRELSAGNEEDSTLFFFDKELNMLGVVDYFISLRWRRKYFEAGEFEIVLPVNDYIMRFIDKDVIVMRNNYTEGGIIETIEFSDNGTNEEITISGRFLSSLLERRIVKSKIIFSGHTIEGMNTLVNAMTPLTSQWETETVTMSSPSIDFQCTYKNVYEYLCKLSEYSNISFRIVPNVDSKIYMFEVWKGIDRTSGQTENQQYSFSDDNYNIEQGSLIMSNKTKTTYVLVGGAGKDDDRVLATIDDGSIGFDRYEIFSDQKNLSNDGLSDSIYKAQLQNIGESKLSAGTFKLEVAALIQQDYKDKWDLGDIVNIKKDKWGIYTTYRIIEVEETIEDGKKTIYPTFGSPLSSAWDDE